MAKSIFDKSMESGSFAAIEGEKAVTKAIDTAIKRYKNGRESLHFAAVVAVNHAVNTGDVRPFKRMLTEMGKRSQTRHNIAAWVRHHCTVKVGDKVKHYMIAGIDKDGNANVRICKEADRHNIDVQKMYDAPYWDVIDVAPKKTAFELKSALVSLINRASKEENGSHSISEIREILDAIEEESNAA